MIRFVYYKTSGKFYAEADVIVDMDRLPDYLIYPKEIGKYLNEQKRLPGLASGTWDGPFTIDIRDKYPELVLPEKDAS